MKKVWALLVLLILHFAVSYAVGVAIAGGDQQKRVTRAHALLRRVAVLASDERYFEHLCTVLKKRLIGLNRTSISHSSRMQKIIERIEKTNGRLWLFDGAGRLALGVASDPAVLEQVFRALQKPWYERSRMSYTMFPNSVEMLGGTSWHDLVDRPDRFSPVNKKVNSGWGYWSWRSGLADDAIAGILAIIEKKALRNDTVVRWVTEDLRRIGIGVGWFNRLTPAKSRLPREISTGMVKAFEREFVSRGEETFHIRAADVAVAAYRDQMLLLKVVPEESPRLPGASWLLLMLWSLPFAGWLLFGSGRAPALSSLLFIAVAVAGILPFGLSVFFWGHFAESRTQAVTASLRQELEQRLVRIDQKFPALIERLATRYRQWRARFEAEMRRDESPPALRIPNRYDLEIKEFATDSAKARLISETLDWEWRGTLDTAFIVDRNGLFWRENSDN
ncbi:MAG TPA: hypothetical protein PKM25_03250, partial [Candidatus Ozemobacteraceae bacterium]|nr:hypothetical protein [Candidatus Ozemobacteraceae bacterium]